MGFSTSDLGYTVNSLVDGAYAGDYFLDGEKIDLTLIGDERYADRLQDIENLIVATPGGDLVPLRAVADVTLRSGPEQINRRERERAIKPEMDAIRTRVKDREITRAEGDAALAALDRETFDEDELALLRGSVSNGDYHYMGSSRILGPIGKAAVVFLGVWFVMQLFQGVMAIGSVQAGGVAWWAHIGGFVVGLVVAIVAGRRGSLRPRVEVVRPGTDRFRRRVYPRRRRDR